MRISAKTARNMRLGIYLAKAHAGVVTGMRELVSAGHAPPSAFTAVAQLCELSLRALKGTAQHAAYGRTMDHMTKRGPKSYRPQPEKKKARFTNSPPTTIRKDFH